MTRVIAWLIALLALGGQALHAQARGNEGLEALEKRLLSDDAKQRRGAVSALANLATSKDPKHAALAQQAWSLVMSALADEKAMVADEAELQLRRLELPAVIEELCGKRGLQSSNDFVRIHAAGALGGIQVALEPGWLVPGLDAKNAEAREVLCYGIEKLGRKDLFTLDRTKKLVPTLEKLRRKDKQALVRAAATLAREALGDAPSLFEEASADAAPEVVCAALRLQGVDRARLEPFAKHTSRAVRAQVAHSLAAQSELASFKLLADMLAAETNARLAWSLVDLLELRTGKPIGRDAAAWKVLLDGLGDDWKPVAAAAEAAAKPLRQHTETGTAVLAGMPIVSQRITFLIDFSGSLWAKSSDGRMLKERVEIELERALAKLGDTTLFNLVPYTHVPIPWEKKLVPANAANVKRALDFFRSCRAQGEGNFWDAAWKALEDPEVDTLLVLTDGAPTGGHRWNLALMREHFAERNRFRHATLDAIVVGAHKGLIEHWQGMCADSGGSLLESELR